MKKMFLSLALLLSGVAISGLILAADAKKSAADSEGFISLFDGKTLKGWKTNERPENWKVEDGDLVGRGEPSHLFYVDQEFQNFVFRADVKINKGGNSGIYFHTKVEKGFPSQGYESQVNSSHTDPVKTGSLYNTVKLFESAGKDETWWTQEITVKGKNVTVKVDGKVLFEYVEPDGVTGPKRLSKGLFAFQQHDPKSVVRYKNIKVKPLP